MYLRMWSTMFLLCLLVILQVDLCGGQEYPTTHGRVRGKRVSILGTSLDVFHGIPFAKPPNGNRRFKHPEAADSWGSEVKDATLEKPACIQPTTINDFLPVDHPRRLPGGTSEDCLYLSIWKPTSANPGSNKAVMVWIYGGSFAYGSISQPIYSGQYLAAENDVIVVSINYRLGPLGFAFLGPDTIPGNMGLMDQVEGLKWVKNNIANFGGDPNRITLFGESAGAFAIGYHLLSPLSRNLFNNAILQSGAPVNEVLMGLMNTKSEARNYVKKLSEKIPCNRSSDADIYACLMAAEPSSITAGFEGLALTGATVYPVVDGYFLPNDPITLIERGEQKKTNILTGVTKDEMTGFYAFYLNTADKKVYLTGKEYGESDFASAITSLTLMRGTERIKALKIFYESEQSPPLNYLDILNQAGSDIFFKCSALQFSSFYAESNDVYLYSFNYRLSNLPVPEWMGVPHSYDIDPVFGLPLNNSLGFNDQDKEMSRTMMKYWSNFAKSGNPNIPAPVPSPWPIFNRDNQTYMALDVGSNLAIKHGFRRHQCAFVNNILPMIPKDTDTHKPPNTWPDNPCPSAGTGSGLCSGYVNALLGLLVTSLWVLHL